MVESKIFNIKNARFYLPNYPLDSISQCMVGAKDYWDRHALKLIDKYLLDNSVIIDIGANVGSHTVYWALERKARKVYSFEPYTETFDILTINIALNNLDDKVAFSNWGLSNDECKANVKSFWECNVGGTSFVKDIAGEYDFLPLDHVDIPEKVDLIKIDVEGHEIEVLEGAEETIKNNKPIIVIETFDKKTRVIEFLAKFGYELVETIREGEDYIFKIKENE